MNPLYHKNKNIMETVSKKNETETEEVNEYKKEHEKALRRLYKVGNESEKYKTLPLSENTRAAIYVRAKVSDAVNLLFEIHQLLFPNLDDDSGQRFVNAAREMKNIANEYILESIEENLGLNADEI